MTKKLPGPGRKLLSALTQKQIESLLDAVGTPTLLEKIGKGGKKPDADMADTVKEALRSDNKPKAKKRNNVRVASNGRLVEDWDGLWQRWDDIIGKVGDEEGNYCVQEYHWEAPYFNGSAVALDLEEVGSEMYEQIDAVYGLVDDPDLFTEALDDIEQAIKAYPDWMGADSGDGCILEYQTTLCVLKWLWLSSKEEAKPGATFLEKMKEIETQSDSVSLDRDAIYGFVTGLPETVCREIHDELHNGRFSEEQEKTYSPWNAIAHEFERRYDMDRYFDRCGRDLEKNWHNGEPLVNKAMRQKDWETAESWLVKTIAAYKRCPVATTAWYPEKSLLVAGDQVWRDVSETAQVAKMLELWSKASDHLGNAERSIASRFQAAVIRGPEQLEKIINTFKELRNDGSFASLTLLFNQWQDDIVQRSLPVYNHINGFIDTWIHWALAAQIENNGRDRFKNKLNVWLGSIMQNNGEFKKHWELLACLTDDLTPAGTSDQRRRFPGLFKTAIERFGRKSSLDKSRRSIVGSLCPTGTFETVMEVWKKRFVSIIPDPAESSNDYLRPVAWAKALSELNPQDYARVVKKWQTQHHRRRNLWQAMHKAGLPGAVRN